MGQTKGAMRHLPVCTEPSDPASSGPHRKRSVRRVGRKTPPSAVHSPENGCARIFWTAPVSKVSCCQVCQQVLKDYCVRCPHGREEESAAQREWALDQGIWRQRPQRGGSQDLITEVKFVRVMTGSPARQVGNPLIHSPIQSVIQSVSQ